MPNPAQKSLFSDLPFSRFVYAIVVAPDGVDREILAQPKAMSEIFDNVCAFKHLVHFATTSIDTETSVPENRGKPFCVRYCGGHLSLHRSPLPSEQVLTNDFHRCETFLRCSRAECNMSFGLPYFYTAVALDNIMSHLMLKQMYPNLHTCNVVHGGSASMNNHSYFDSRIETIEQVKRLGSFSLFSDNILRGTIEDITIWKEFSLGFTVCPPLNTRENFDGAEPWARYLVQRKLDAIRRSVGESLGYLIGPKPMSTR